MRINNADVYSKVFERRAVFAGETRQVRCDHTLPMTSAFLRFSAILERSGVASPDVILLSFPEGRRLERELVENSFLVPTKSSADEEPYWNEATVAGLVVRWPNEPAR